MLNKSRGNGHPFLVLDFNRKLWNYHHWIWCWLCVCHMWNLLCWNMFSLYLVCCVFIMNGCWICQTLFLHLLIMWFLSFVLSVWFITFVVSDYKWKKIGNTNYLIKKKWNSFLGQKIVKQKWQIPKQRPEVEFKHLDGNLK